MKDAVSTLNEGRLMKSWKAVRFAAPEKKIARLEENSKPSQRYEVQFQKDSQRHSTTNDLVQAQLYARALANWNLAAQVYDRVTKSIVFRAQSYREQHSSKSPHESSRKRPA